jgi:hypothetical protein
MVDTDNYKMFLNTFSGYQDMGELVLNSVIKPFKNS